MVKMLCRHEDLGSDPQHLPKKPGMMTYSYNPSAGERDRRIPAPHCPAVQTKPVSFTVSETKMEHDGQRS